MTRAESSGTEKTWTSGQAAARRKALTDAGMERPVAETLVDLLDEQAAPMMTRAEADARFAAMLDRHDAQRAQERAEFRGEMEARFAQVDARFAQVDARFAELKGEMDARFGEMHARFGSVEGKIAGLEGQMGTLKWTFGSRRAVNTLLLAVLASTVAI